MEQDSESIKITQTEEVLETPKPQPDLKKPANKKRKIIIWILSTFALLCAAAAGVFAYLYFTNSSAPETEAPEDTTIDAETLETTDEEVEITDTYIKRDLDEKIAILYNTTQTGSPIIIKKGTHPEYSLYINGNLSENAKLSHVAESLKNHLEDLNWYPDREQKIMSEFNMTKDDISIFDKTIDANTVAKKYQDVFGEVLDFNRSEDGAWYCPHYRYSKTLNMYIRSIACGGTSPHHSYYYKTKYTKDANHAYVYVSAVILDVQNGKLYCSIGETWDYYETAETCGSSNSKDQYGDYQLDESTLNLGSLGKYRFVFKKADNGTYYFEKVEKL